MRRAEVWDVVKVGAAEGPLCAILCVLGMCGVGWWGGRIDVAVGALNWLSDQAIVAELSNIQQSIRLELI